MKICRVVPILDTVGHMTNYTCIGPVVIVNLILFSISGPSTFLVSKLRFEVFNMICVSFSSFSDSFRKNFWEAEGFHENFKVFRLGSNFRSQLGMAFRVDPEVLKCLKFFCSDFAQILGINSEWHSELIPWIWARSEHFEIFGKSFCFPKIVWKFRNFFWPFIYEKNVVLDRENSFRAFSSKFVP